MKRSIFERTKVSILSLILKFLYGTNKITVKGEENYLNLIKEGKSIIFSVWHGHLLSIVYDLRNLKINALAGTHDDADLISQIAIKWGWNVIRGSSKEKGSEAYKAMIRILSRSGSNLIFITPDGPSGPPRIPKKGVIKLAQRSQSAIIPINVNYTKNWGFRNWDTFYVAKPFGNIFIDYRKPIYFDEEQNNKTCEEILIKSMENK